MIIKNYEDYNVALNMIKILLHNLIIKNTTDLSVSQTCGSIFSSTLPGFFKLCLFANLSVQKLHGFLLIAYKLCETIFSFRQMIYFHDNCVRFTGRLFGVKFDPYLGISVNLKFVFHILIPVLEYVLSFFSFQ